MKVVLEPNVLVSGIFFSGLPAGILRAWSQGRFQLVLSPEIFDEYKRVSAESGRVHCKLDLGSGPSGW